MGNEVMYEKAQKKHKNYLRRQRAKQAKAAQKEKDKMASIETSSVSGVSTNSSGSVNKNLQKKISKSLTQNQPPQNPHSNNRIFHQDLRTFKTKENFELAATKKV